MRALSLFVALVAFALSGCKSPCRQLSEKLCECSLNSVEKDSCLTRAQTQANSVELTAEDEQRCTELLPGCDCKQIKTAEGKVACGFARPPPQ